MLGWRSAGDTPEAGWNKGALTTTLLQFVEAFCRQRNVEGCATNERLRLIALWHFHTIGDTFWDGKYIMYLFYARACMIMLRPVAHEPSTA